MKVKLLEAPDTEPLIEAEIDCSKNPCGRLIGPCVIRWRDMDFLYFHVEKGIAIYVRPRWTTVVNWYPNETGEKWTG